MKYALITITMLFALGCSKSASEHDSVGTEHQDHTAHEIPTEESKPKSPAQMAMANVGNSHVHIEYNAPGKRGRVIFGGLVAYDEVWVTGAHNATTINFSEDVKIGDTSIEKGRYALFTIPGKDEWTVIINTNWDQHLADDYNRTEDVVRVNIKPTKLTEPVESLTFEVTSTGDNNGTVSISWDDIMVSFEVLDL